jgi:hypothetical protein
MKNKDKEFKKLKSKYNKQKEVYSELENQISELRKKQPDLWKTEEKLSKLSHKYKKNDIVVLNTYEVAEVSQLIGRKMYKLFVPCKGLRGGYGTHEKRHEDSILCHTMDLLLEKNKFKYKTNGIRDD